MATMSGFVLTALIAWALLLLVWMEMLRAWLVMRGRVASDGFTPGNDGLSPFMQRLARAHANCLEGLPIFGGLLLVALVTGRPEVTDTLAPALLAARLMQSAVHLWSTSIPAINVRFAAFSVQMVIGVVWAWRLLVG